MEEVEQRPLCILPRWRFSVVGGLLSLLEHLRQINFPSALLTEAENAYSVLHSRHHNALSFLSKSDVTNHGLLLPSSRVTVTKSM